MLPGVLLILNGLHTSLLIPDTPSSTCTNKPPFYCIGVSREFVGSVDWANWDPIFLSFSEQFIFGQPPHELQYLGFYEFEICIAYVPVLPNRVHESLRPAHPFEQTVPVPPRNDYDVAETVTARIDALRHASTQGSPVSLSHQDRSVGAVVHDYVLLRRANLLARHIDPLPLPRALPVSQGHEQPKCCVSRRKLVGLVFRLGQWHPIRRTTQIHHTTHRRYHDTRRLEAAVRPIEPEPRDRRHNKTRVFLSQAFIPKSPLHRGLDYGIGRMGQPS